MYNTEPPGSGGTILVNTNVNAGFYKCIKCGEKLYSSTEKKHSKDWPLFHPKETIPVFDDPYQENMKEIKCPHCYSHLGHTFKKGHCVNSLALTFLPLAEKDWRKYIGVLPYSWDAKSRTMWFLLGQEHVRENWPASATWSCFGGSQERETIDDVVYGETHLTAAAREFDEETQGFFGCQGEIEKKLSTCRFVHMLDNAVTEYFLPLNWEEERNVARFYNNNQKHLAKCSKMSDEKNNGNGKGNIVMHPNRPKGSFEKMKIGWVKYDTLLTAIGIIGEGPSIPTSALPPNAPSLKPVVEVLDGPWRPSFLKSFRELHRLGILDGLPKRV